MIPRKTFVLATPAAGAAVVLPLLLLAAGAGAAAPGNESRPTKPKPEDPQKRVRTVLEEYRAGSGFPGAIAAVHYADGTSFAVAVGYSDRDAKSPMKESDLLHAGSVGKLLFAAVALQLVDEKLVGLDEKLAPRLTRLPWFKRLPNFDSITLRMLLNHTSGLPAYGEGFMRTLTATPGKLHSPLEAVLSAAGAKPVGAPGAAFYYSDLNYQILAYLIEQVTAGSAYTEIRSRILTPHGYSSLVPANQTRIPGLVPGYAGSKNPFGGDRMVVDGRLQLDPSFEWGGGGFVTNPRDLARFIGDYCEGRAFSPQLLPEVFKTVDAPDLGPGARGGLGIEIESTPLGEAVGHGGYFPGYFTQVRWYRAERMGVALQLNTSDESLVKRPLKAVIDDIAQAALPSPPAPAPTGTP